MITKIKCKDVAKVFSAFQNEMIKINKFPLFETRHVRTPFDGGNTINMDLEIEMNSNEGYLWSIINHAQSN